jgi:CheY-like chemotaxis protein
MGLRGQLEDMPFVDILQIMAFSKKTGYLHVESPLGRGAVVFQDGKVMCAYSWSTLGYLKRIADGQYQEEEKSSIMKEQVETSLRELARLREGGFHFQLTPSVSRELEGADISPFLLQSGINTQHLLMDLAKDIDDDRRDTTAMLESVFRGEAASIPRFEEPETSESRDATPASVVEPPASDDGVQHELAATVALTDPTPTGALPEPTPLEAAAEPVSIGTVDASAPQGASDDPEPVRASQETAEEGLDDPFSTPLRHNGYTVVVVDDEPEVTEVVGEELTANGYRVFTATAPVEGTTIAKERVGAGDRVLVVADLKMPTSTGRSFFGGFELVRRLQRAKASVPVLLMAEYLSDKARRRALKLGIRKVAFKPALSKLDLGQYKSDLRSFAGTILGGLGDLAAGQMTQEQEQKRGQPSESATGDPSLMLNFLASMTEQLSNPHRSVDISRMVLQVAEKFFGRGILFLLKDDKACGLSGFGLATGERENAALVRRLGFDIDVAKPFGEVVNRRKTQRLEAELDLLQPLLFCHIGRGRSTEAALVPMLNNAEVLLILYGDNAVTGKPLAPLVGLELFMAQAGMALENVFLQGKLHSLDSKLSVPNPRS